MLDFKPPLDSPLILWWVKINLPLYMKLKLRGTTIKIMDGALERFAKLKGKRAMICPNHSNRHDPQTMFAFGKEAGEYFNFVAAREVFDYDHGINGWWLQHVGSYSVVRGAADRESFKTTRRILSEGPKKLVLFPEGEISRQNDTVMALESGAAQLSFWALADMEKKLAASGGTIGGENTIYIQPMAFKYTFPRDISSELRETLKTLETKLSIKAEEGDTFQVRLKRLADALLTAIEREYGFKRKEGATMNERVKDMRVHILTNLAAVLNIELDKNARELEWVRVLRNKLDDYIYEDENKLSDYEREMHEERERSYKTFYRDLSRVVNFICIYDGYFSERSTQERFSEIIDRMETEILGGEPSLKGPREVLIDAGEAIDLSLYYEQYKKNKKQATAEVTALLATRISEMLVKMEDYRKPIYLDAPVP